MVSVDTAEWRAAFWQVWHGPEDPLERPALVVSFVVFDMVATGPVYKALDEDGSGAIQRFEWESVLDKAKAKRFACGFSSRLKTATESVRLDTSGRPGPSSAMSTRPRGEDVQLTSEMTRASPFGTDLTQHLKMMRKQRQSPREQETLDP